MFRLTQSVTIRHNPTDNSFWAFNNDNGDHYELNESSFFILKSIHHGENEVIQELTCKYDIDLQTAKKDVDYLLKNLERNGLVERTVDHE